ncbi:helicase-associated domain-containing protein [Frondihabitans sp. 4ASC-45]|uniref:helicase-associated domain-containing protein n=1 Tax=Frondihabitans sp. 4ASC-45 TaxID=3111636 RepID=UPI003C199FE6
MASALDLAGVLRALDAETLRARLLGRAVPRPNTVKDAFDLAETLLDRASLRDVLSRLDRVSLIALRTTATAADAALVIERAEAAFDLSTDEVEAALARLSERLLVLLSTDGADSSDSTDGTDATTGTDGTGSAATARTTAAPTATAFDTVTEALDDDPLLTLARLAGIRPPVVLEAVEQLDDEAKAAHDTASAERLYAIVVEVAEIVRAVTDAPARELARGGLALPESRRLAEAARIDVDDVAPILVAARAASLVELGPEGWIPGPNAEAWLLSTWADRWASLVSAWLDALPAEVRTVLAQRSSTSWGEPLRTFSEWLFPAGGSWVAERLDAFARAAELFGLTSGSRPTSAAVALLGDGVEAATEIVRALLPQPIDQVYLQHDLTVVAPGPLAPDLDARLRLIADVESAGLAATYRVTETRIQAALSSGETADSLREFLTSLSSTGVPQPVDYLLTETADRHGRYRVADLGAADLDPQATSFGAVSQLRADDPALLDTAQVDQALRPIGLFRAGPLVMLSRFDAETVYWALLDERYPVLLEDADRRPTRPPLRRRPRRSAPPVGVDPLVALVERVQASSGTDDDTERAWISRQLDSAAHARLTVLITLAHADGTTSQLTMEPTGVGGGRVRGRDRKSDIERTLPLSSIVAVATPPA